MQRARHLCHFDKSGPGLNSIKYEASMVPGKTPKRQSFTLPLLPYKFMTLSSGSVQYVETIELSSCSNECELMSENNIWEEVGLLTLKYYYNSMHNLQFSTVQTNQVSTVFFVLSSHVAGPWWEWRLETCSVRYRIVGVHMMIRPDKFHICTVLCTKYNWGPHVFTCLGLLHLNWLMATDTFNKQ